MSRLWLLVVAVVVVTAGVLWATARINDAAEQSNRPARWVPAASPSPAAESR